MDEFISFFYSLQDAVPTGTIQRTGITMHFAHGIIVIIMHT